jgi:ribokinase
MGEFIMFKEERRELIFKYLREHHRTTVKVLASIFQVTKETVRSDLAYLEQEGLIKRFYGGAYLFQSEGQEPIGEKASVTDLIRNLTTQRKKSVDGNRKKSMKGKVCILGSFNVDIVARVERFPQGGETVVAKGITLGPGGKGCNQAMAAFFADADVHFFAKVGTDHFSQFARNHFKSSGMDSYTLYQTPDAPTGSAVIYVSAQNGENIIAISPGANQTVNSDEINALQPHLAESNVLLVQLENNIDAVAQAMKLASTLGNVVILNPAPYTRAINDYLGYVDIITPNETEASQLSGIEVSDIESAKQAALKIAVKGIQRVLITMGSRGVLVLDGGQFHHIPAFPAVVVDTTGAGDAFNGALAAALARGNTLINAVKYAAAFASLAVEREGAANMPDDKLVQQRLGGYDEFKS